MLLLLSPQLLQRGLALPQAGLWQELQMSQAQPGTWAGAGGGRCWHQPRPRGGMPHGARLTARRRLAGAR